MNQMTLSLNKQYSKDEHIRCIPQMQTDLLDRLTYIYDSLWETKQEIIPYEILTELLDCYYCLPERPDLAALFCWQALNHSYNEFSLSDPKITCRLKDSDGIDKLIDNIYCSYSKYKDYLFPYIKALPDKAYRFVASYVLKGHVLSKHNGELKYANQSYPTFTKKYKTLYNIIDRTYGDILVKNSAAKIENNQLHTHADPERSRKIVVSLSQKLRELVEKQITTITIEGKEKKQIEFTEKQSLEFVIRFIIYASRCSNFHGNVAARLNSDNAHEKTFAMYTNLFLLEYMLLAISLNIQGKLSDECLKSLKNNETLLL